MISQIKNLLIGNTQKSGESSRRVADIVADDFSLKDEERGAGAG
jgi:hypothetical protein